MEINFPLNMLYDKTYNCPECGQMIYHIHILYPEPQKPVKNVDGVFLSQSIDLNY